MAKAQGKRGRGRRAGANETKLTSAQLHFELLEQYGPPSILIDQECEIVHLSENAGRFLRFAGGEPSRNLFKVIHPDLKLDLQAAISAVTQNRQQTEARRVPANIDGKSVTVDIIVQPVRLGSVEKGYMLVLFSEKMRRAKDLSGATIEMPLRGSEEHLRLLIESISDYAIFSTDLEGFITRWNPGAEKIFEMARDEAIGQNVEIIFTPEDRERGVPALEMKKALAEGRAEDERWHMRRNGSRFFASGVISPLRDGEVIGFVKILRDLTERRMMEERLLRSRDELDRRVVERTSELEQSNARIKDLLRRIVRTQELERRRISRELHDQMGQQLTALRLSLESLESKMGDEQLSEELRQMRAIIMQIEEDLDFLTWQLRPAALEQVGLAAALENFLQEWSRHFRIPSEFHTAGFGLRRLAPEIETNLYRMAQEALNNIVKHADASRAALIFEKRGRHAVLIIEDNGKGFDPEQQAAADARGLGLISMRERAALVGGTLEIESRPGEGTTIFVRVPARLAGGKENG
ncbi:MAG TPA: PAS domain S-box protein [Blastocatellia bacterium]|nr:PAS domain S-box protein [Blastocatellia bacterium]